MKKLAYQERRKTVWVDELKL